MAVGGSDKLAAASFREVGLALGLSDPHQRSSKLAKLWTTYAATLNAGALVGRGVQSIAWYAWIVVGVLVLAGVTAPPSWLRILLVALAGGGAALWVGRRE